MKCLFTVKYDIKNVEKSDSMYGVLVDKIGRFPTLQAAIRFSKQMENLRTSKFHVVGRPIIERAGEYHA